MVLSVWKGDELPIGAGEILMPVGFGGIMVLLVMWVLSKIPCALPRTDITRTTWRYTYTRATGITPPSSVCPEQWRQPPRVGVFVWGVTFSHGGPMSDTHIEVCSPLLKPIGPFRFPLPMSRHVPSRHRQHRK